MATLFYWFSKSSSASTSSSSSSSTVSSPSSSLVPSSKQDNSSPSQLATSLVSQRHTDSLNYPQILDAPHQPRSFHFPRRSFGSKKVVKRGFNASWFDSHTWLCSIPYAYFVPYAAYGTYHTRMVHTIRVRYDFPYHTRTV